MKQLRFALPLILVACSAPRHASQALLPIPAGSQTAMEASFGNFTHTGLPLEIVLVGGLKLTRSELVDAGGESRLIGSYLAKWPVRSADRTVVLRALDASGQVIAEQRGLAQTESATAVDRHERTLEFVMRFPEAQGATSFELLLGAAK